MKLLGNQIKKSSYLSTFCLKNRNFPDKIHHFLNSCLWSSSHWKKPVNKFFQYLRKTIFSFRILVKSSFFALIYLYSNMRTGDCAFIIVKSVRAHSFMKFNLNWIFWKYWSMCYSLFLFVHQVWYSDEPLRSSIF